MSIARITRTVLLLIIINFSFAFATPRDVQYHYASTEINTLLENNIMKGYEDGRFRPNRYINREEACVLLVNYAKKIGLIQEYELSRDDAVKISDVQNEWSVKEIEYLYREGIIETDSGGNFNPAEPMNREFLALLIYNFYNHFNLFKNIEHTRECTFTDLDSSNAKQAIIALYETEIINGFPDNTYRPEKLLSRAEMAMVIYRISGLLPVPAVITLPTQNIIDVPYISQINPLKAWVGCEPTSLLMGLHSKGYSLNVGLEQFLDDMPKTTADPAKGFVGSPYIKDKTYKTRTTIYPQPLTAWAFQYGNVADFSGSTPQDIQAEILDGNPVVVYVTLWWNEPIYKTYDIEGQLQSLLTNNHAVLASGYDMSTNRYYIADPYNPQDLNKEYKYWIDGATFDRIYNERRHAVVIQ